MNERIEKFKFHRQLRKIDWDSVIKATNKSTVEKTIGEKMKRFSWYTNPVKVTDYLTVYQYAVDREILIEKRKDGSRSFILVKKGAYVTSHDGGWLRFKPNRKGGHHHRRNYCICHVCGNWFRRNKGFHDECSDGPLHFCSGCCARQAEYEASLEADVGGGFVSHYWDDDEDAEWRRKNGRKEKV